MLGYAGIILGRRGGELVGGRARCGPEEATSRGDLVSGATSMGPARADDACAYVHYALTASSEMSHAYRALLVSRRGFFGGS